MTKERNIIQEVLSLIQQLEQERGQHQQRIEEIDSALAQIRGGPNASVSITPAKQRGRPPKTKTSTAPSGSGRSGRGGNAMSFREAAAQATAKQPMSLREIVEAVKEAGYRFQSADPIKSAGAYLYGPEGKKHFKRVDGKFSALNGSVSGGGMSAKNGSVAKPTKAKRTMSVEARKKIAEAARARWAKQKAAKK